MLLIKIMCVTTGETLIGYYVVCNPRFLLYNSVFVYNL